MLEEEKRFWETGHVADLYPSWENETACLDEVRGRIDQSITAMVQGKPVPTPFYVARDASTIRKPKTLKHAIHKRSQSLTKVSFCF